jgi:hypothetical protein
MSQPAHDPTRSVRSAPARSELRLEYRGFRDGAGVREYLLRARIGDEQRDYVVGIEQAAFAQRRLLLQDGPDVCFQRLARELSGGVLVELGPLAISEGELASYREAHAVAGRKRSAAPPLAAPLPDAKPQ